MMKNSLKKKPFLMRRYHSLRDLGSNSEDVVVVVSNTTGESTLAAGTAAVKHQLKTIAPTEDDDELLEEDQHRIEEDEEEDEDEAGEAKDQLLNDTVNISKNKNLGKRSKLVKSGTSFITTQQQQQQRRQPPKIMHRMKRAMSLRDLNRSPASTKFLRGNADKQEQKRSNNNKNNNNNILNGWPMIVLDEEDNQSEHSSRQRLMGATTRTSSRDSVPDLMTNQDPTTRQSSLLSCDQQAADFNNANGTATGASNSAGPSPRWRFRRAQSERKIFKKSLDDLDDDDDDDNNEEDDDDECDEADTIDTQAHSFITSNSNSNTNNKGRKNGTSLSSNVSSSSNSNSNAEGEKNKPSSTKLPARLKFLKSRSLRDLFHFGKDQQQPQHKYKTTELGNNKDRSVLQRNALNSPAYLDCDQSSSSTLLPLGEHPSSSLSFQPTSSDFLVRNASGRVTDSDGNHKEKREPIEPEQQQQHQQQPRQTKRLCQQHGLRDSASSILLASSVSVVRDEDDDDDEEEEEQDSFVSRETTITPNSSVVTSDADQGFTKQQLNHLKAKLDDQLDDTFHEQAEDDDDDDDDTETFSTWEHATFTSNETKVYTSSPTPSIASFASVAATTNLRQSSGQSFAKRALQDDRVNEQEAVVELMDETEYDSQVDGTEKVQPTTDSIDETQSETRSSTSVEQVHDNAAIPGSSPPSPPTPRTNAAAMTTLPPTATKAAATACARPPQQPSSRGRNASVVRGDVPATACTNGRLHGLRQSMKSMASTFTDEDFEEEDTIDTWAQSAGGSSNKTLSTTRTVQQLPSSSSCSVCCQTHSDGSADAVRSSICSNNSDSFKEHTKPDPHARSFIMEDIPETSTLGKNALRQAGCTNMTRSDGEADRTKSQQAHNENEHKGKQSSTDEVNKTLSSSLHTDYDDGVSTLGGEAYYDSPMRTRDQDPNHHQHYHTCNKGTGNNARAPLSRVPSVRRMFRRVQFDIDERTEKPREYIIPCPYEYDDNHTTDIWWTREQIKCMEHENAQIAKFFACYRNDYVEAALSLLSKCAQSNADSVCLRTDASISLLVDDRSRGLEADILPMLRNRQRRSIQCVIDSQELLRESSAAASTSNNSVAAGGHHSRMLALKYQRCANYATVWARILADGDAINLQ